jgi:alpha-D-ribose 1-methylphosphonate 5-triphosphate diphosphatase
MQVITKGKIVTEDEIVEGVDLVIDEDRIAAIVPEGCLGRGHGDIVLDAQGGFVMPGFIDVHADYIEHMAAPRPSSLMDFSLSIREAERELVTHGITTMFHSLAFFDHSAFAKSPIRSPENARKFIDLIDATRRSKRIIRHRFHARFEIDNIGRASELAGYLRDRKVHLVSFMDHTPGQGQYRDLETYRETIKGYNLMRDDSEIDRIIEESRKREKLTMDLIEELAALATANGVAVASHDDDTVEKVALVRGIGATISEFPTTLEAAREAKRLGMQTVVGAPNVLLGGSHAGNLSALEAVRDGSVDILCSDYYPAAMIHAVFKLRAEGMGLPEATRLVSINPARAVGMNGEIGSIAPGKKADILIVEEVEPLFPAVTAAFVDGHAVFSSDYRG